MSSELEAVIGQLRILQRRTKASQDKDRIRRELVRIVFEWNMQVDRRWRIICFALDLMPLFLGSVMPGLPKTGLRKAGLDKIR
jgi:hypothetical protein